MSADDFVFLDVLSSVPNDIRLYSSQVADYVDRHLERASNALRETLSSAPWLPESARPRPPPAARSLVDSAAAATTYARVQHWVATNKLKVTIGLVSVGGIVYLLMREKRHRKKRRAKKAGNGARLEVVVVAGSPSEPITRSISLDLERRGFIVYVVCNTIEEEVLVHNESRPDIRPLMIDIVDPESTRASIERFMQFLQSPHAAFQGAKPHHLTFRSLVLVPSLSYPSSPIATLSPSTLSDLLNTRLLTPILTLQSFLPILASPNASHQHSHAGSPPKPSVLVLTPSIISSLSPAFHAPESSIVAALSSFTSVLSSELAPLGIPVTHLKLGNFDTSLFSPHSRNLATPQSQRAETLKWDRHTREMYGRNFVAVSSRGLGRGSSLRELNDAVFDALVSGRGGTVRVGMGSKLYGFVGRWVPGSLVGWMIGLRAVSSEPHRKEFGRGLITSSEEGSRATSPGSQGSIGVGGLVESDFIPIYGEKEER